MKWPFRKKKEPKFPVGVVVDFTRDGFTYEGIVTKVGNLDYPSPYTIFIFNLKEYVTAKESELDFI